MSADTPNLALPTLAAGQAQKHVTVNEALARADAAAQLSVESRALGDPPGDPPDGARWLVAASPTGAWEGREGEVAAWDGASLSWRFLAAREGWRVWVADESVLLARSGGAWWTLGGSRLGVGTGPDDTNRLAVASPAVLLTHAGADMRAVMNKATDADTASLVFQSGYAGHAEIGLAGDTAFSLKVSADGAAFAEAMRADPATARVSFAGGAVSRGALLSPEMLPNLLPDGGRFGGLADLLNLRLDGFVAPSYLQPYNGSTISPHAKFIQDNDDYGGNDGALDPEVRALVDLLYPAHLRQRGLEWYAALVEAGQGGSRPNTVNGVTYPLAFESGVAVTPDLFSVSVMVRVLSGAALMGAADAESAGRWGATVSDDAELVVTAADGWTELSAVRRRGVNGFRRDIVGIHATPGSRFLVALPRVVRGEAMLDPYPNQPLLPASVIA